MIIFIAVCAGVLVITHLTILVLMFKMLENIQRASQALEGLAYRTHDLVSSAETATQKIVNFANWTSLGWPKFLPLIMGVSVAAWSRWKGAKFSHTVN